MTPASATAGTDIQVGPSGQPRTTSAAISGRTGSQNCGSLPNQALQNVFDGRSDEALAYFVFDLPHCDGYDLTRTPLISRKTLLQQMLSLQRNGQRTILYSDHIVGHGQEVFEEACAHALEGVISKKSSSRYEQRRTGAWLKSKCTSRQEFVIGGFTDPKDSRIGLGALLVGYYSDDGRSLVYAGKVGTGYTHTELIDLRQSLSLCAVYWHFLLVVWLVLFALLLHH